MRSSLALAAALAGCWSGTGPQSPPPPSPRAPSTAPPEPRAPVDVPEHSVWRGAYSCLQGDTALTLTLDVSSSGQARAVFEFGALAANPAVPSGSFLMLGTVREHGGRFRVRLVPDRWVVRPPNYMMVRLEAESDAARTELVGRILEPGCGGVELTRDR